MLISNNVSNSKQELQEARDFRERPAAKLQEKRNFSGNLAKKQLQEKRDFQEDPAKQTAQLQDAIASGKYDGIVLCAIYGVGLIPDIEAAIAAGIEIVVLNQVVGADLTTSDPQVDGIAASVLAAPYRSGTRHGNLTVKACEGNDDCKVVFIYGIKGIPLDPQIESEFIKLSEKYAIDLPWTIKPNYIG